MCCYLKCHFKWNLQSFIPLKWTLEMSYDLAGGGRMASYTLEIHTTTGKHWTWGCAGRSAACDLDVSLLRFQCHFMCVLCISDDSWWPPKLTKRKCSFGQLYINVLYILIVLKVLSKTKDNRAPTHCISTSCCQFEFLWDMKSCLYLAHTELTTIWRF